MMQNTPFWLRVAPLGDRLEPDVRKSCIWLCQKDEDRTAVGEINWTMEVSNCDFRRTGVNNFSKYMIIAEYCPLKNLLSTAEATEGGGT
uniref:Uncharacterized protein n=1 Tax=Chromera velia CCMP2878 TaxID=1169474 RepID=A0A0G4G2W8_9ALVE|eukprot:Cvel_4078.t1-p1 / transcript=Cvel_4078.t1 / gene=Cvel_4078 / organism=Chromera_velia_CCMP2878 / gene_product=hypothetical protein / transcript_product=hypothetical protein / location=Cvel_scaffold173:115441-115704(-) / protein_length=88 / sequence_SO=supercontig / SO=protein_coding / is_pseudo=false